MQTSETKMPFTEWLAALNAEAKRREYAGGPLSEQTGEDCWRDSYDDGMSPVEALDEDESCA